MNTDTNDRTNYDRASTLDALATSPTDRGYLFGYLAGLRRRMNGGAQPGHMEYDAYVSLVNSDVPADQQQGRGYMDGLSGVAIGWGEG